MLEGRSVGQEWAGYVLNAARSAHSRVLQLVDSGCDIMRTSPPSEARRRNSAVGTVPACARRQLDTDAGIAVEAYFGQRPQQAGPCRSYRLRS